MTRKVLGPLSVLLIALFLTYLAWTVTSLIPPEEKARLFGCTGMFDTFCGSLATAALIPCVVMCALLIFTIFSKGNRRSIFLVVILYPLCIWYVLPIAFDLGVSIPDITGCLGMACIGVLVTLAYAQRRGYEPDN